MALSLAPGISPSASASNHCTNPDTQLGTKATEAQRKAYSDSCGCYGPNISKDNCGIVQYMIKFINVLSAIVGVVIVIMIAIGGIQYSVARDNPQATVAARAKIINALVALVIFLFSFSFLQWVVPGGIF